MTEGTDADRVLTVLKNCSTQLRRAHSDLSRTTAPIDSLTKISGVADALDAITVQVAVVLKEVEQNHRTIGGLSNQVNRLRHENSALSGRTVERI